MATGRPREFDTGEALERAMEVFWRKGYDGASLSDLTAAMGITRPSLYAAFGNKEALFRQALGRYEAGPASYIGKALQAATARAAAEQLLNGAVDLLCDRTRPDGCMMVQSALACSDAAAPLRRELAGRRAATQAAIRRRFEQAQAAGDLTADCEPAALAGFLLAVIRGMAVEAAGGASRRELRKIAAMALRAWPG